MKSLSDFDRAELERLARLRACHGADRLDEREVSSALRRWEAARGPRRSKARLRAIALAFAVLLLSGVAAAVSTTLGARFWAKSRPEPASPRAVPSGHLAPFVVERGGRRSTHSEPVELDLLPGEHAAVVVGSARMELVGPGRGRVRPGVDGSGWVPQFEPHGFVPQLSAAAVQNMMAAAPAPSAVPKAIPSTALARGERWQASKPQQSAAPSLAANPPEQGAWSRAAVALRDGNEADARAALRELGASNDAATRDAALLAQAQLDIARGRREVALPRLRVLAQQGATPFVRERAAQIVAQEQ